ncbi:hypothetical protein ABTY98_17270 [Streptomyces sp. NPDC096040]
MAGSLELWVIGSAFFAEVEVRADDRVDTRYYMGTISITDNQPQ